MVPGVAAAEEPRVLFLSLLSRLCGCVVVEEDEGDGAKEERVRMERSSGAALAEARIIM